MPVAIQSKSLYFLNDHKTFFQKTGIGAALWAMGQVFAITTQSGQLLPIQPEGAVQAVRWIASIIPAALLLVGILIYWKYTISREAYHERLERMKYGGALRRVDILEGQTLNRIR